MTHNILSSCARRQAPTSAMLVLLTSMLLTGMLLFEWPKRHLISTFTCAAILVAIAVLAALSIYRAFVTKS